MWLSKKNNIIVSISLEILQGPFHLVIYCFFLCQLFLYKIIKSISFCTPHFSHIFSLSHARMPPCKEGANLKARSLEIHSSNQSIGYNLHQLLGGRKRGGNKGNSRNRASTGGNHYKQKHKNLKQIKALCTLLINHIWMFNMLK